MVDINNGTSAISREVFCTVVRQTNKLTICFIPLWPGMTAYNEWSQTCKSLHLHQLHISENADPSLLVEYELGNEPRNVYHLDGIALGNGSISCVYT